MKTLHHYKATAQMMLNKASKISVNTYNSANVWVANVDRQSIRQYLAMARNVLKNTALRSARCLKTSYKLARSKKYQKSNAEFLNGVTCFGLTLKTCVVACSELLMITQLLRNAGYVKSTPHHLLSHINSRVERLTGNSAIRTLSKVNEAFKKIFAKTKAVNTSQRGYSFLSAGIKTKKSA